MLIMSVQKNVLIKNQFLNYTLGYFLFLGDYIVFHESAPTLHRNKRKAQTFAIRLSGLPQPTHITVKPAHIDAQLYDVCSLLFFVFGVEV